MTAGFVDKEESTRYQKDLGVAVGWMRIAVGRYQMNSNGSQTHTNGQERKASESENIAKAELPASRDKHRHPFVGTVHSRRFARRKFGTLP